VISAAEVREIQSIIRELFLADKIPWVIGYSGGKDSTATLQLVWYALRELPDDKRRHKEVHVISTDTQVEQPVIAHWVSQSLKLMEAAAERDNLPFVPHRLFPKRGNTYWVNLIGRGYPAPRRLFRWCTSRLKIEPSNRFILDVVKTYGETILVLGTRKSESAQRAANMERYEKQRIRKWLSPNASLVNSYVFTPIEDWTTDDVWVYLMQYDNPWGCTNKDLLSMYRGASEDNECPLVVDTSTPSCGNTRFGCWVCTLVARDKSMEAMIQNDLEHSWMKYLLEFRDFIANTNDDGWIDDRERRDYRRANGTIKLKNGRAIPGPYLKAFREELLTRLLKIQQLVKDIAPRELGTIELITFEELREIREIWVLDKHEFDDALPRIYEEVTGRKYPYICDLPTSALGQEEWSILEEMSDGDHVFLELLSSMLDIHQRHSMLSKRKGLSKRTEALIRRCYYKSEEDAVEFARRQKSLKEGDAEYLIGVTLKEGNDLA